jgi:hypothetical protein
MLNTNKNFIFYSKMSYNELPPELVRHIGNQLPSRQGRVLREVSRRERDILSPYHTSSIDLDMATLQRFVRFLSHIENRRYNSEEGPYWTIDDEETMFAMSGIRFKKLEDFQKYTRSIRLPGHITTVFKLQIPVVVMDGWFNPEKHYITLKTKQPVTTLGTLLDFLNLIQIGEYSQDAYASLNRIHMKDRGVMKVYAIFHTYQ